MKNSVKKIALTVLAMLAVMSVLCIGALAVVRKKRED